MRVSDGVAELARPVAGPVDFREPDRFGSISCLSMGGFHRMAFTDWGPVDADEVVICVHGLTRQGRDFDILAARLADAGYRVICPDLVGRGQSGWLRNALEYVFPQYCADMGSFLATLGGKRVHWLGTSFGGLVGLVLGALPRSPIATLTLNDIGPDVPMRASARVALRLISDPSSYGSMEEVLAHVRKIYAACGPLTEAQWRHMARHSVRRDETSGRYVPLMDPKITTAYQLLWYYSMSLWKYWNELEIPLLAIHGDRSDFVPKDLLARMKRSRPSLRSFEVAETGHMPMLMSRPETEAVLSFLQANG